MPAHFNLQEHLKQEHKLSPVQTYLKEIVYGGTDGIVTTFAVVAGFTGAQNSSVLQSYPVFIVLLFGLANLFSDSASMALGSFLSLRSEQDVYKAEENKELHEIRTNPKMEKEETIAILHQKGFSQKQAETLTEIYSTNEKYWLSFMMNHELQMPNPTGENALLTSLSTFLAFIIFGFIPLIPYIFIQEPSKLFMLSAFSAFAALTLLGILRWKVTIETPLRSILEIVGIGSVAASIAYFVGTFFHL